MAELRAVMALLRSSFGGRPSRSVKLTETDHQVRVSRYFADYVDCGKPGYIYVVRHPFKSLGALIALFRLPCLHVAPSSEGAEGAATRHGVAVAAFYADAGHGVCYRHALAAA